MPTAPQFDPADFSPQFAITLGAYTIEEQIGMELLCFEAQAKNLGQMDATPDLGTFTAVTPSGVVSGLIPLVNRTRRLFAVVVPGGTTTGDICFQTNGERGDFRVRYRPMMGDEYEMKVKVA